MTHKTPQVSLTEVAFFQEGPGLRKWQWTPDGMKVINVTNILGDAAGTVDVSNTDKFISLVEFEEKYKHFAVEHRDIVVASSGNTYGKVGRINQSCLPLMMNTSVIRFHSLDANKLDDDYLYVFLRSPEFRNQVEQFVIGGAQPNFGPSHLKKMVIPLPDITIQRRIGEFLSAYDDLIENNRRRIQLLEQAARLLYKEWFVHLRFPGHEHTQIIDGVPEGWEKKKIVESWDISYGKNLPTKYVTETGKYPVHGADSIIGYHIEKNVDESLCLVTCRGNGSGNVRRTFGPTFVTNNCFVLRPKYRSDSIRFYFTMMAMEAIDLRSLRTGAAQPQLTIAGIEHVRVLLPASRLLKIFNQIVGPIYAQADTLRLQNEKLAKARDLLLPKLMDGEVAV